MIHEPEPRIRINWPATILVLSLIVVAIAAIVVIAITPAVPGVG